MSFLHTTIFRDQLPSSSDFFSHPLSSISRFFQVYKLHVAHESEKVAAKRRRKLDDAQKRKEFLKEHGVEPGFLTGTWMDKFGTVEGDQAKAAREGKVLEEEEKEADAQSPVAAMQSAMIAGDVALSGAEQGQQEGGEEPERRERKKPKMWLGIW